MSTSPANHGSDMGAAFTGLVVGAIVLFVLLFGIVKLTAAHYQHEQPAAGAQR